MKKQITINADDMICPHFDRVLFSHCLNKVLKGGRGSTKSSVISIQLVMDFLQDSQANVLIMRKVANTIELSVYEQIKWAIYMLHVDSLFEFKKSPYRIVDKRNGTAFYFSGVDDPQKLKSMIIAHGYVRYLWFEELAEFDSWQEVDMVRASFTRKQLPPGAHVVTYYSYNPPKNPYEWINEWVTQREGMSNWYVDHSTYEDVTLPNILSQDYIDEINTVKQNNYDYYRWMYLGEVIGLGTNIYNMDNFQAIDKLPTDDYITNVYYSVDTGHEVSATTCGAYGLTKKGNVILLDTYYYSPQGKSHKKPPSELSKDLKAFIDKVTEWIGKQPTRMTIDSAEGALDNQFYNDYGIHWHKVNKLKKVDMIDRVQDLLAQGRFYYLKRPENDIFIAEHRKYQWDENTLQSDDPKVIKEDDHTCDQFMYLCLDNERDLGLKW
ncbi:PBSX family phage terminase large subunit [Limosilactobacillus reuteri]|uniref:PBSX family phage terminase large subunit n=1 Tax=Limosilactobacillus reuteri TaxID=1598 RepID=UPI001E45801C|nr:PBSX family phage terminase large subunit [Limosilactobacillus reuteri]MCC4431933.1 PBSX family phage terminase large subunit [Limosilactobacillus reuteri]MCC4434100.1 PBSX family phage terminase large subunit [Limosilactobacillus reuteri]